MEHDVVIVGASISGCTAAIHYGRAGLRVALVERNRSIDAHKALCGHFILGGAQPTLRRLGLWDRMVDAGASVSAPSIWTSGGWLTLPGDVPEAISLRRSRLDPMLRRTAAATPGVDLILGHTVTGLIESGPSIAGVVARSEDGAELSLRAPLVVGADGHRSRVAVLAGTPSRERRNGRFLVWAYYRGVELGTSARAAIWLDDPHVAVAIPTDDDLTLLGAFPTMSLLPEFRQDRLGALERFIAALPDGPALARAARASKAIGTTDHTMTRRAPTPRPGLALIGDAATASDPVPAVGCTWALLSAEWLADATSPALRGERPLAASLRDYRHRHRFIDRHDRLLRSDAKGRRPNPVQAALRRAALHDEETAARLGTFFMRADRPSSLLNPTTIARALRRRRPPAPLSSPGTIAGTVERSGGARPP